jgi:hypothetical protein
MATTRAYHNATLLDDGTVLVTGGWDYGSSVMTSAEVFDPGQATFSPTGPMATARYFHAACLLNDGRVLVTGGRNGDTVPLRTAEIYH